MGLTFAEKVLAGKAGLDTVVPGQIVFISPDHLLSHDNTAAIIGKIGTELDKYGITNPDLHVIVLDHVIPAASEKNAEGHKKIREYVKKFDLPHFYDIGRGICHQVMMEEGLALPGQVVVGSDSHTCSYGALGCFATGVDRTEAAALILTGKTWFKVPVTIKITLTGELGFRVTAKDVILQIIADLGADGAGYKAVEFHGNTGALTLDDRFTIANMGIEMGAKIAVFPTDSVVEKYLAAAGVEPGAYQVVWADPDAVYEQELTVDLSRIEPVVACPHAVDNGKSVTDVAGLKIHQGLLGTCTNGRAEDFRVAAEILKGKQVHPDVRLLLLPASRTILQEIIQDGTLESLVAAGGVILPPGCGPCLGAHQGALAPGERCISTANRNFKGRMGCADAETYLAGPATLAASVLTGVITDPRTVEGD